MALGHRSPLTVTTNPSPPQQEQSERSVQAQSSHLEITACLAAVKRQRRLAGTNGTPKL